MNYMLRILGPLAAFAVIFGLAYCTQSAEEIYNRTDNFFVDTETEQSFEFQLNNYTDKPLMLVYQKREGEWNLGGIVPYSEGGGAMLCFHSTLVRGDDAAADHNGHTRRRQI